MPDTSEQEAPIERPPGIDPSVNIDTPAMRQYFRFKREHPDCVLFFRMGDFYEMFFDDAILVHKVLGVTLTQRTKNVPMAGVPFHAAESYLRRMIQAGHRVAVCEQMEDPAHTKGVVRRDVTRVITPGTLTDESFLEEGASNHLAAVVFHDITDPKGTSGPGASVAWAELSTGEFHLATFPLTSLSDEIARIRPSELLYVETSDHRPPQRITQLAEPLNCAVAGRPAWQFRNKDAIQTLKTQFGVATLSGFGLSDEDSAIGPASAVIHYLLETQKTKVAVTSGGSSPKPSGALPHLSPPRRFEPSQFMVVDQTSLRSLEVERTIRSNSTQGTLLGVFQKCATPMGKRLLRQWLCYPLADKQAIKTRQRTVGAMIEDAAFRDALSTVLDSIQDVQRILSRVAIGRATPRDLVALAISLAQGPRLAELLEARPSVRPLYERLAALAPGLKALSDHLLKACIESPPNHMRDGGLIRDGFDPQLDECRQLQTDSDVWLASYQKTLIQSSGINSLKVGFNKVFGFYIELTAGQRDKAPAEWSRKQTLKNAERFITPELKDYEGRVLTAKDRAIAREGELFFGLCTQIAECLPQLHAFAEATAELDVLACFADRAVKYRYCCPELVDEPILDIKAGRHPVLDQILGDRFVPNDILLGSTSATDPGQTLALITGPNMAGKSTYIRTAALLTLLAHTGSYIPADAGTVGLCDRVFTRIGASDELHAGASTFMVEMTETANICHHATAKSLVILDEIGRGTSTLDGLSLAWAIAEHLAQKQPRTLFATHYHELTSLADVEPAGTGYPNVTNLHVTVREWQEEIVFLHRIAPGRTDRSYGIHVAKIAGLPKEVVNRANALLSQLAVSHSSPPLPQPEGHDEGALSAASSKKSRKPKPNEQLSLFTEYLDHPALAKLKTLDIDNLTPVQAFDILRKLREAAQS